MVLNNVTTITSNGPVNIQLKNGQLIPVDKNAASDLQLTFNDALAFPGLVNWHDHLDFNLFPQLGDRVYNNYTEWGAYIHKNYKEEIAAVLKVPLDLRVNWGIYKNLLCGVTTVVNHGGQLNIVNAPINVEQCHSIHSVQFEKLWKIKLNNPFKRNMPAMIHVGEGSDESSKNEIDQLLSWNLANKKLIGIHGVAMTPMQAKKFEALIWCPESNFFLLNKTAPVNHLKKYATILFGTDSTLTGNWNIWDHIRLARKTKMLTDTELYDSLHLSSTVNKQIQANKGTVVVAQKEAGQTAVESFYATDPAAILLVVYNDEIRLFDDSLLSELKHLDLNKYSKIIINGARKYVQGDLPELMKQVKTYYPEANFPVSAN